MTLPEKQIIDTLSAACGVSVDADRRQKLAVYFALLSKWQRRANLTAVTDPVELFGFHFLEAFWASQVFFSGCSSYGDVGSGAGLPGLAMKLYRPELKAVLMEKDQRKALFLTQVADQLALDAEVFHGRAEEYPQWFAVSAATMRALRPSGKLLEILSRSGTRVILFHGRSQPQLERWAALESRKFPLSKHRWVTLYVPQDRAVQHPIPEKA
jgi:16S rRNA (guanine(527)-N(7))-methyltransferase RsmG